MRLLFVDDGSFHHEHVSVPVDVVGKYDRLIDCFFEDPDVLKRVYVDADRLCAATLVDDED